MKKIITYCTICLIASIVLSSCGSYMSLTKRHYNKGYYVSINNGKQSVVAQKAAESISLNNEVKSISNSQDQTAQNKSKNKSAVLPVTKKNVAETIDNTNVNKLITQSEKNVTIKSKIKTINNPVAKIKRTLSEIKKGNTCSSNADELSVFWVVILILLILWAVGLLAGGWGLGGLINILLVIALILLILWLLRVV